MLLIAHPVHNSLPAALEILAQVQQEGGTGRIYLLKGPDDSQTLAEIEQTARCLAANQKLSEDRLGVVGESLDWLVASSQRPEVVTARFGMKVVPMAVDELRAHIARDPAPAEGGSGIRVVGPGQCDQRRDAGRDGPGRGSLPGTEGPDESPAAYDGDGALLRSGGPGRDHRLSGTFTAGG